MIRSGGVTAVTTSMPSVYKSVYVGFLMVFGINWVSCRYKKRRMQEIHYKMEAVAEDRNIGGRIFGNKVGDRMIL